MNRVPLRYQMNLGVLKEKDINTLNQIKVTIVGLGGIGGNVVNQLVRLGVKNLNLVDFDVFSESNLNRQLFSKEENIGLFKVEVIRDELRSIHSSIEVNVYKNRIQDVEDLETDYLIDCVDNIETKTYLSKLSKSLNVNLLHGSCGGWYGQVGWITPNSTLIEDVYKNIDKGLEEKLLNPVFAPSVVASYMVSEFTKMIINEDYIKDELLLIDLFNNIVSRTGK